MATPSGRSRPDSQSGVLLPGGDALYEILLRLPARDLCRLRAVCRPWRRLLSDPHFIAAHAGRHPEPLIVAGFDIFPRNDSILCDVMDLSGRVVKRVRRTDSEWVTSIHLNFVCTSTTTRRRFRLLNLATGSVFALPEELAVEHAVHERDPWRFHAEAVFGQVPSTGEYKVLHVVQDLYDHEQLYEVTTLNGGIHAQWRGKKPPPYTVNLALWSTVVINGIVYFFSNEVQAQDAAPDRIASFDLETEEWRASLRGPLSSLVEAPVSDMNDFTMSDMDGCLVVVHRSFTLNLDLWFLMDFERGIWVKKHSILSARGVFLAVRPLLVLNDGRIVLFYMAGHEGSLKIYNPRNNGPDWLDAKVWACQNLGLPILGPSIGLLPKVAHISQFFY